GSHRHAVHRQRLRLLRGPRGGNAGDDALLPAPLHPLVARRRRRGAGARDRAGHRTHRLSALRRWRLGYRHHHALGHDVSLRSRRLAVSSGCARASNADLRVAGLLCDLRAPLALAAHATAGRHHLLLVSRARQRGAIPDRVPAHQPSGAGQPDLRPGCERDPRDHRRHPLAGPEQMARSRGLKIAVVTAALGVAAVLTVGALQCRAPAPAIAPDFAVPDLDGQAVRLSNYRGKVVLLNLWATWCPPCREEMPSMERLFRQLRDRGFVLLAVSQDEAGRAAVDPFVRDMGLTFPVLVDPQHQVGDRYQVWGYPESFIIDR